MPLASADPPAPTRRIDGYKGIWFTLGQMTPLGDKYSGGFATYTANHVPIAIHAPAAKKTFFVYGGTPDGGRYLLDMISYYDHARGVVPRPVVVHDKQGVDDPHDNPSLAIDGEGFLWVFVSGRAKRRPGFIYRSLKPYDIDGFTRVHEGEFTYPQPRWFAGHGFLHLFTKYTNGRELYWSTSPDGKTWSPDRKFAGMGGHYQTSARRGDVIVTAFNMHPGGNVDKRTNLYCAKTDDRGQTWRNVGGDVLDLPLTAEHNPALLRDYRSENRLVYIHDLDLDSAGHPVILYTTSTSFAPGPGGDPRWWTIARFTGTKWEYVEVTRGNHNYSTGALLREGQGWRIIGPTEPGPQPIGAGAEVASWTSADLKSWKRGRIVTKGSPRNHNYVRRVVDPHPDFTVLWADGNPNQLSESHLYFANHDGSRVYRLPYSMTADSARPERLR